MKTPVALFWSGGKDSSFALHHIRQEHPGLEVVRLITTLNLEFKRISMHGVREELLDRQAENLGLPLDKMWVPNEPANLAYEEQLHGVLAGLRAEGINHVAFGDIFLEDLKQYRDKILSEHHITGVYPLWKKPTDKLIRDFLRAGFRTVTCCINTAVLSENSLGIEINEDFIAMLPVNADPCGENGEFHTFCFDGPVFNRPVDFRTGEVVFRPLGVRLQEAPAVRAGFSYIDLYL
ncbi:adenine nucleotide alpha hydrolase [Hufsiella ginkgonis]|uniref:ATP-binding protein n=1 Tax=Hufsiella ginkgonis TaxID=2695274 RepID=A0A7K1XZM3_9SPHI|nr:adenine nucleotide alpha hydrolase [Hufsiella ginkgonis]MXV16258.1 ATP-binding protein [Hufsiella ginkgonis]